MSDTLPTATEAAKVLPSQSAMARWMGDVKDAIAAAGGGTSVLTSAHLFVGNGSNVATDTAITGDITFSNSGVTTLKNTGTAGTYGDPTHTLTVTTDAQGRVTAVTTNTVTMPLFSTAGVPILNLVSPPYPAVGSESYTHCRISCNTADAVGFQLALIVSGTTSQTLTLTSGTTDHTFTLSPTISLGSTDNLTIKPTAVSGISDVTVRFLP